MFVGHVILHMPFAYAIAYFCFFACLLIRRFCTLSEECLLPSNSKNTKSENYVNGGEALCYKLQKIMSLAGKELITIIMKKVTKKSVLAFSM